MNSKKSYVVKGSKKLIYTIRVNNDIVWEGENVHEVFPTLKETYKDRDLSIHWQAKKETGAAR